MDEREIVGRDDELAAVTAFLSAAEPASALLLEGEAGIGKTTIWVSGVEQARARGYRALVARPARSETPLAFSGLIDLLGEAFDEVGSGLPTPQRRALAVALLQEEVSGPPPEPGAIAVAVREVLRRLAARDPLLVALDDVQWLDGGSASALAFAARRIDDAPISFLLTRRAERDDETPPLDLARSLQDRFAVVRVGPLSLGALHRLLQDRLGSSFPRPVLRKLHETSAGNPFFALELGRALERAGRRVDPGQPLPVPGDLHALLRERFGVLPERARDALALAAALPEPAVETIEQGLGESIGDDLRRAVDAQLVDVVDGHVHFVHPLFANAASLAADQPRLRQAHRRLAELLSDPVLRADQLAHAADGPDESVAAALEGAAGVAGRRGSQATAAEFLERAAQLTPSDDETNWARRLTEAGVTHARAGDEGRGMSLWQEVIDRARPGSARAAALGHFAWEAVDLEAIDQALAEVGDDLELRVWLDFVRLFIVVTHGSYREALPDAYAAVESAEAVGNLPVLVQALSMLAHLETVAGLGDPLAHLTRAADLVSEDVVLRVFFTPTAFLGRHYVVIGELDGARRCFDEIEARAENEGDEQSHAQLLVFQADLEWRAGNFLRAAELGQELIDFLDQAGDEAVVGRGILRLSRILGQMHVGDVADARTDAQAGVADAQSLGAKFWEGKLRAALGAVELTAGDYDAAVRVLEPMAALENEAGVGDPCVWMYAADELEALVGVGRLDEAEVKLSRLEERARDLDRPWIDATAARCRGLLQAALGDVAPALETLDRAVREHDRLQMPFERARTLLAQGQVQRRAKRRAPARGSLERAQAIFEELGATLWAQKAQAELARIGGRAPTGGLTPTEQRIAALVADGRSNKEVAAELFVTVKTVEANLTRIYAKLDVRSRTELARRLRAN